MSAQPSLMRDGGLLRGGLLRGGLLRNSLAPCLRAWTRRLVPSLACLLVLCGLFSAWSSGPAAWADEDAPLARLTAEERTALERRIPGLAGLAREKQELIVRNILRLRGLDREQRQLVERRFKAAREAGLGGQDLAERGTTWRHMPDVRQTLAEWQGKVIKALGWRAWRELPVSLREQPSVAPLLAREWPAVFHQRYLVKAVAALDGATAEAWQPSATMPQAWQERFQKERAKLLEGVTGLAGERSLLQLKKLVLQGQALETVREAMSVAVTGPDTPAARLLLLGERLGALTGSAFAETTAEFAALAERKGPEAFASQVRELAEPPRLAPEQQLKLDAYQVVVALESWRSWFGHHPELVAEADALLRAALVNDLGMPAARFEQLPARDAAGDARAKALRAWVEESLPRELRRHAFKPRGAFERPPGGWGERGFGGWRRPGETPRDPDKPK